ncbi:hypothetical protein ACLBWX_08610 [Methylobacterium sp. M6A4_1b]
MLLTSVEARAQAATEAPAVAVEEEARPGPPPPLPDLADSNGRAGEPLNQPGQASGIPRALRGSADRAGGPANDLTQGDRPDEPPLPKADLAQVLEGRALFHGNYCGAGQRGEGLPPTDDLDAACMRHDACFDAAGHRSCACNATLEREASAVSERPGLSRQIRERALSVAQAADVMGCQAP